MDKISFQTINKRLNIDFELEMEKFSKGEYGDDNIKDNPVRLLTKKEREWLEDYLMSEIYN